MANPYQTCPSQFYQQLRQQKQPYLRRSNAPQIPTQQRQPHMLVPTPSSRGPMSQTLNSRDYAIMQKTAQMYNNNPRKAIPRSVIYQDQMQYPQHAASTSTSGQLAELRDEIYALNSIVTEICRNSGMQPNYPSQRCGAMAPTPNAMQYGPTVDRYHDDMDSGPEPYITDSNFFSPARSPPPFSYKFVGDGNDGYSDYEDYEDDYVEMVPTQPLPPPQAFKPTPVHQAKPVFVQQVEPQYAIQMQRPPRYTNPYRQKQSTFAPVSRGQFQQQTPIRRYPRTPQYQMQPQFRYQTEGPYGYYQ
ncbi:Uncharacterized protein QTN25_008752 [Entamoeba marina]